MAIASVGTMGSVGDTTNGTNIVLTTATTSAAAGSLVVVCVAKNNASTAADSVTNEITSVTDSIGGNTWTKCTEWCNSQASVNAGATVAMYYSVLTNAIATGSTITANFSNSKAASAISAWNYSIASGSSIYIAHIPASISNDASDPGAIGQAYTQGDLLWVRATAVESDNAAGTATGSWTLITRGTADPGSDAVSMTIIGEFRSVFTNGNDSPTISSNITYASFDSASILVGFREVFDDEFNHYGGLGTATSNSSTTTVASPAISGHGPDAEKTGWNSMLVCSVVFDNTGTGADGDGGEVTGVADDDGNTWTKAGEWVNTNGAAGSGVGVAVYYLLPPADLTSAIVTATFVSARTAKIIAIQGYMYKNGQTVTMEAVSGLSNDAGDFGNIDITAASAVGHAWFRVNGSEEATFFGWTNSTNYTVSNGNTVGSGATGLHHLSEQHCTSTTNAASDPTATGTPDRASMQVLWTLSTPGVGGILDPIGASGFFGY